MIEERRGEERRGKRQKGEGNRANVFGTIFYNRVFFTLP